MKNLEKDFGLFARDKGISSMGLHQYKNMQTPYIMEERQLNVSQIDVFSRLMMERIIWLNGPVENFSSTIIQAQLLYLQSVDSKKDITLHLDTIGGEVMSGKKIIDIMTYISPDVSTINTGICASMGAVILGAGAKGKRGSLGYSKTMIHASSGGAVGNIHDARITMAEWEKENKELFEMLGEYCGKPAEEIELDANRDKWLNTKETIDYGLIDFEIGAKRKK